jgi:hypothetical protein
MSRSGLFSFKNEPIWLIYFWEWADLAYLFLRMSWSGLFNFENEPIWLIHDSHSFFFLIVLVELCRLFESFGLKYSSGTGSSRYLRSSLCPGSLSGARDAERPTSSKCRHDCRLPRGPDSAPLSVLTLLSAPLHARRRLALCYTFEWALGLPKSKERLFHGGIFLLKLSCLLLLPVNLCFR